MPSSGVLERRYYPTVALVAAIDKSGSMAGTGPAQKIEVAKAGAAAAIGILENRDEAGVIGFDSAAQWVARLRSLSDRRAVLRELGTLRAGGGTNIYPAMVAAYGALKGSGQRVKHLILLSDGMSPAMDYDGLARKMRRDKVTVTTVAVGTDADTQTMRAIARAGGGRAYTASDPAMLPRIFTKEAMTVQRSYVVEEMFTPRLKQAHAVLSGVPLDAPPVLTGYVATHEKGEGELLLTSHRNDPILSVWRVGLGKAVAFTPDVEGNWTRAWVGWGPWGQLWSQIFRWSATGAGLGGIHLRSDWQAGKLTVVADALGDDGEYVNFARLVAATTGPGGERREVTLRQTGPGRYQGELLAPDPGAYLVSVTRRDGDAVVGAGKATVDVPYSPEFRPAADGRANLERVAALTGARIVTDPAQVFARDIAIPGTVRELRPALLYLLPFLLLLDVGARRVALPEGWFGRLTGPLVRLLPSRAPSPEVSHGLGRLRSAKHKVAHRQQDDGEDAAAPEASPPAAPARAVTARAAPVRPASGRAKPAKPAGTEAAEQARPAAAGSTTSRLLDLKRRTRR